MSDIISLLDMKTKIIRFLKQLGFYCRLPEMRPLGDFFLVAAVAIINLVFLKGIWALIISGILLVIVSVVFAGNLRLARSNWEVKIERNQLHDVIENLKDGRLFTTDFKIQIFNKAAEAILIFQ